MTLHFSTIDLRSGYHYLRVIDSEFKKQPSKPGMVIMNYVVISFGQSHAHPYFMDFMNSIWTCSLSSLLMIFTFILGTRKNMQLILEFFHKLLNLVLFAELKNWEFWLH